jgi:metal-responsive CopG/Arc/MetJ family transcriptional regulator
MRRATISLPDDLAQDVEREAQRRRTSVSALARDALRAHLGIDRSEPKSLPFVGVGRSGQRHTARDAEEILAREWGRARGR